jgi:uncharacterized protein YbjT (DUF2867 family)|tara:strand:+ start:14702 stop:15652 length:951 start_codon:yes stop_codon:yes gene_type:complete
MQNNQSIVVLFGGSGQIGRSLLRRLTEKGYRVIVVTRSPYRNLHLKVLGNPGQIDLEKNLNLLEEEKIKNILESADIVINLCGILYETKRQKFDDIHSKFPGMLSSICENLNIDKLIHISALGVNEKNRSKYMQSKLQGEKNILKFKKSIILRPSLIFGKNDSFFNKFASMAEFLPALPLFGSGSTKFTPIWVEDVSSAIIKVMEIKDFKNNIYELGGPEVFSFKELMEILLKQIKKKRLLIPIPWTIAKYQAKFLELFTKSLITQDQLLLLQDSDNIITGNYPGLNDLNINSTSVESILPDYIYRFRKGGHYTAS